MATIDQSQDNGNINSIQEVLPGALQYSGASMSSTVQNRQTSKFFPVGTDTYTPNGNKNIQFRLSSNNYIDPTTTMLNFHVQTTHEGTVISDLVTSIFQKVQLKIGGILVESHDQFGEAFRHLFYSSCSEDYYRHYAHAQLGAYLHKPSQARSVKVYTPANPENAADDVYLCGLAGPDITSGQNTAGLLMRNNGIPIWYEDTGLSLNQHNLGYNVSIPLSFLFGVFRTGKYLPLRNFGEIMVEITLNDYQNCCYQFNRINNNDGILRAGDTNGLLATLDRSYNVRGLSITTDILTLDPVYVSLMDNLVASDAGIILPFETYTTSLHQMPWQGMHTILISKGASHLKSVYFFMKPAAIVNSRWHRKEDTYFMNRIANYQFTIGSDVFPLNRVESTNVAIQELSKALGHLSSTQRSSLLDRNTYLGLKTNGHETIQQYPTWNANGVNYDIQTWRHMNPVFSMGSIGLNTERVIGAGSQTLSGINTKLRGYNIQLQLHFGDPGALHGTSAAHFADFNFQNTDILGYSTIHQDKLLIIKNSAVAVSD